jgi:AcrR family transcriptional regulator
MTDRRRGEGEALAMADAGRDAPPPRRGRPRVPSTDDDIIEAARTLLDEGGYEAMSFEAVAQRAGVTRPTIYRRWPTRVHLANEIANGPEVGTPIVDPDEDIRAEIRRLIDHLLVLYNIAPVKAANAGIVMALQRDPELRAQLHTPREMRARVELRAAIEKAKREEVIRPEIDSDVVFDTLCGAVIFRTMISSLPTVETTGAALYDLVVRGMEVRR